MRNRVELVLELANLREVVLDEEVELAAARCIVAYRLLGGKLMTLSAWRARVRELLSAGNGVAA
jgi:hypothetical protein